MCDTTCSVLCARYHPRTESVIYHQWLHKISSFPSWFGSGHLQPFHYLLAWASCIASTSNAFVVLRLPIFLLYLKPAIPACIIILNLLPFLFKSNSPSTLVAGTIPEARSTSIAITTERRSPRASQLYRYHRNSILLWLFELPLNFKILLQISCPNLSLFNRKVLNVVSKLKQPRLSPRLLSVRCSEEPITWVWRSSYGVAHQEDWYTTQLLPIRLMSISLHVSDNQSLVSYFHRLHSLEDLSFN